MIEESNKVFCVTQTVFLFLWHWYCKWLLSIFQGCIHKRASFESPQWLLWLFAPKFWGAAGTYDFVILWVQVQVVETSKPYLMQKKLFEFLHTQTLRMQKLLGTSVCTWATWWNFYYLICVYKYVIISDGAVCLYVLSGCNFWSTWGRNFILSVEIHIDYILFKFE